ncbi:MAG: hypothetical protein E6G10_17540 [Actinobacteria bacterium]|nr:MAG: hypothetical protein E6G10_17540 [Actinomycetota bacterium]
MTPPFEVLRFTGVPAGADVCVLELEGRFAEAAADRTPDRDRDRARLVVENAERQVETPPVAAATLADGSWRATYALPLSMLAGAVYALAVGRDLLLDLPAPDVETPDGGAADPHVRLAREANELRARLDQAEAAHAAADERAAAAAAALAAESIARAEAEAGREREAARADEAVAARERAEAAVAEAKRAAEERVAAAKANAEQALAKARAEHEAALAKAGEEHERQVAEERDDAEHHLEEAIAAERARAAVTSHELRSARAELEALRRELALRRAAVARPHRVADRARAAAERPGWPAGANGAPASPPADDPDATNRLPEATETVAVSTEATAEVSEQGGEGFRVLTPRAPRPRHRAEDEPQPGALPPGAAATGARSFEPAMGSSSSTRMLAVVALAVAILAAILVVVLRVGLV